MCSGMEATQIVAPLRVVCQPLVLPPPDPAYVPLPIQSRISCRQLNRGRLTIF